MIIYITHIDLKMSNFPIQMQTYDSVATEQSISQLQIEMNEEVALNKKLDVQDSETKIAEAQTFVQDHGEKIKYQYDTIDQLDKDLRQIIIQNKTLEQQDVAFDTLINSAEYVELAQMMSQLKSKITSLDAFLVEHGVKGPASQ